MFKNLFISYKIGLKNLGKPIPFHKNSLCMKILIIFSFICIIISIILSMFIQYLFLTIFFAILGIILLIIYDNNTLNYRLEECFIPYSEKRRKMIIDILKKYKINTENLDSIDMLIEEAKFAQMESGIFEEFKIPFKRSRELIFVLFGTIAGKITDKFKWSQIETFARKIMENFTDSQIMIVTILLIDLILLIFLFDFFNEYILKKIFYSDYYKYNEFIRDLREIKLFYIKQKRINKIKNSHKQTK